MKGRKCGQSWFKDWDRGLGEASPSARSFCPSPNELPQRGQCSTEVIEFRFTGVGLLHEPETLRAQVSSLMEVQRAGPDEGGDAEGLRNGAPLSDAPLSIKQHTPSSANSSPKVLGRRCVRGLRW